MNLLFIAGEAVPFIKTGGLGDVTGSLAKALARRGHDTRLVVPKYRTSVEPALGRIRREFHFQLSFPWGPESLRVVEVSIVPGLRYWLVDAPRYYDREGIYTDSDGRGFPDNDRRFILLSRAGLETARRADFAPDIAHAHDWMTGLVPVYLSTLYRNDPFFQNTASVFSIHNMAHQGVFSKDTLLLAGLDWAEFTPGQLEFYDRINFLKGGIAYADMVNTVSPAYADEVRTEAFGHGLDGVLRDRGDEFVGILNGLDTDRWTPARDPCLATGYTSRTIKNRALCREDLQKSAGLDRDPWAPVLGMVSRLDPQKGFDILLDIMGDFIQAGCQAVFLGSGHRVYQAALATLARQHRGRVAASSDFNETLAHKIYAGADIFLMPSRFEPCGLGQLIALRYGTVPVVTPTGGLKNTVTNASADGRRGVGFVADEVSTPAYRKALARAVAVFRGSPHTWRTLQRRGMALPLDWAVPAEQYEALYDRARQRRKARS